MEIHNFMLSLNIFKLMENKPSERQKLSLSINFKLEGSNLMRKNRDIHLGHPSKTEH
jgi:hypothetical protein